jgi:hypothetical protein
MFFAESELGSKRIQSTNAKDEAGTLFEKGLRLSRMSSVL